MLLGYEEATAELGRSVLILATHGRADAAAQVLELAGRVDGMVVLGRTVSDEVVIQLARIGPPLVLLAREPVGELDTIRSENAAPARKLAEHLIAHGYRRFAFLGDPEESPDVADRRAGFAAGLQAAGVRPPRATRCTLDVEAGRAVAGALLRGRRRREAFVCANDEVALGVHLAATEAGLRIPADLAVTGWDDVMAARFVGLTTARQPARELGAIAARWLHDRMVDRTAAPVRRQVLPTQLVVRDSCGTHG